MSESTEQRSWQDQEPDTDKVVDAMRQGIRRVRDHLRSYREVFKPERDPQDEA